MKPRHDPMLIPLIGGLVAFGIAIGLVACSSGTASQKGTAATTITRAAAAVTTTSTGRVVSQPTVTTARAATTTTSAVSFTSCAAAQKAGYHDMKRGQPGYSPRLDGDGDGVACDTKAAGSGAPTMTFTECQKSAQYDGGGQYAFEYDNGVCTVQRP